MDGLFACGEAAGNFQGANRLAGALFVTPRQPEQLPEPAQLMKQRKGLDTA